MKLELRRVTVEEKPILSNLMEKYNYDFSLYEKTDVSALGLYGYDWLDCYWTEKNRWAFFITADGKLAGFVMVSDFPELPGEKCDYAIAEFFVMNKYKRTGVGSWAARTVFDMFRGRWQLKYLPTNVPSKLFWDRVVTEYTGGKATLFEAVPGSEYHDGTPGNIWLFDNSDK